MEQIELVTPHSAWSFACMNNVYDQNDARTLTRPQALNSRSTTWLPSDLWLLYTIKNTSKPRNYLIESNPANFHYCKDVYIYIYIYTYIYRPATHSVGCLIGIPFSAKVFSETHTSMWSVFITFGTPYFTIMLSNCEITLYTYVFATHDFHRSEATSFSEKLFCPINLRL